MEQRPRVALDVETSRIYGRRILEGITRYLQSHQPWSIYVEQQDLGNTPRELLKRWRGDGIITRQAGPTYAKKLRRSRIAVVDLSDIHQDLGFPRICSADSEIASLAAEHLRERGFTSFACCGFSEQYWSSRRSTAFTEALDAFGFSCELYESQWGGTQFWEKDQSNLCRWLEALPKPLGLFATNDVRGQHILDACFRCKLAVPEEVAVIGVDNDELLCGLSNPPLTSVIPNPERIGYEAASLLNELMTGRPAPDHVIEVPPLGIETRQSTDILAIPDNDVASAVSYIRKNACSGATVNDVLRHVPVSRSLLERRFRKYLNRSPQAEIRNVQIKRIKELLAATDLPLERIAALTGFEHPEYMSVVFKRETGDTPGRFRRNAV